MSYGGEKRPTRDPANLQKAPARRRRILIVAAHTRSELVRVAQTIACCGEIGGVAGRCEITECGVWTLLVVIGHPARDPGAAWSRPKNRLSLRSSSRIRPLKLLLVRTADGGFCVSVYQDK